MKKLRGFKLPKRLILFSRWLNRYIRPISCSSLARYYKLTQAETSVSEAKPSSKLLSWRFLLPSRSGKEKSDPVPKDQLAVYVGEIGGKLSRVLVPVVYFKHRLFIDLLREAEEEYGFEHEKGITLPCGYSKFERIRTQIRDCGRTWRRRRNSRSCCSPEGDDDVWRREIGLKRSRMSGF